MTNAVDVNVIQLVVPLFKRWQTQWMLTKDLCYAALVLRWDIDLQLMQTQFEVKSIMFSNFKKVNSFISAAETLSLVWPLIRHISTRWPPDQHQIRARSVPDSAYIWSLGYWRLTGVHHRHFELHIQIGCRSGVPGAKAHVHDIPLHD